MLDVFLRSVFILALLQESSDTFVEVVRLQLVLGDVPELGKKFVGFSSWLEVFLRRLGKGTLWIWWFILFIGRVLRSSHFFFLLILFLLLIHQWLVSKHGAWSAAYISALVSLRQVIWVVVNLVSLANCEFITIRWTRNWSSSYQLLLVCSGD